MDFTADHPAFAAYQAGDTATAIRLQSEILAAKKQEGSPKSTDYLALALFLYVAQQFSEGCRILEEAARLFPNEPSVAENWGVMLMNINALDAAEREFLRALRLGSESTNIYDGLGRLCRNQNRLEESRTYGKRSLALKAQKFGTRAPLFTLPDRPPPPFNWESRSENVISYCLWGGDPRYVAPLMENLRMLPHLFPAWTIRIYLDHSVPEATRNDFIRSGGKVLLVEQKGQAQPFEKLIWRFEVVSDPSVKRFLIRDADSLLSVKERVAVDDWVASDRYFHAMRDSYTHTDLLLAGMWGGIGGVMPPVRVLRQHFRTWRAPTRLFDQDLLADTVWPTAKTSCLIHDSIFTGTVGSVPFPPFGRMAPGHHIGQNSFIHFKKND